MNSETRRHTLSKRVRYSADYSFIYNCSSYYLSMIQLFLIIECELTMIWIYTIHKYGAFIGVIIPVFAWMTKKKANSEVRLKKRKVIENPDSLALFLVLDV